MTSIWSCGGGRRRHCKQLMPSTSLFPVSSDIAARDRWRDGIPTIQRIDGRLVYLTINFWLTRKHSTFLCILTLTLEQEAQLVMSLGNIGYVWTQAAVSTHATSPPSAVSTGLSDILPLLHLAQRQDLETTSGIEPLTTSTAQAESSSGNQLLPTQTLAVASRPIPLAPTMGLIMPNPWESLYVGE